MGGGVGGGATAPGADALNDASATFSATDDSPVDSSNAVATSASTHTQSCAVGHSFTHTESSAPAPWSRSPACGCHKKGLCSTPLSFPHKRPVLDSTNRNRYCGSPLLMALTPITKLAKHATNAT